MSKDTNTHTNSHGSSPSRGESTQLSRSGENEEKINMSAHKDAPTSEHQNESQNVKNNTPRSSSVSSQNSNSSTSSSSGPSTSSTANATGSSSGRRDHHGSSSSSSSSHGSKHGSSSHHNSSSSHSHHSNSRSSSHHGSSSHKDNYSSSGTSIKERNVNSSSAAPHNANSSSSSSSHDHHRSHHHSDHHRSSSSSRQSHDSTNKDNNNNNNSKNLVPSSTSSNRNPSPMKGIPLGRRTLWGARSVEIFEKLEQVGEGTFGKVYMARNKDNDEIVALKKVRMENEKEGFPITAIREIKILKELHHSNIVQLKEIVTSKVTKENEGKSSIYMVFEYMDHDLTGLMMSDSNYWSPTPAQIKCYMKQLLEGLHYCHTNGVLHRDIKGSNLLINNQGQLKLADFGLARPYTEQQGQYTNRVITLWYRPPELLLGAHQYGPAIDMWSVGCILAELLNKKAIFPGKNEIEQLDLILQLCGSPNPENWPDSAKLPWFNSINFNKNYKRCLREVYKHWPKDALDLVDKLLTLDPTQRISASQALDSDYFWQEPLPCDPLQLPKYPSTHEFQAKKRRQQQQHMRQEPPKRPKGPFPGGNNPHNGPAPLPGVGAAPYPPPPHGGPPGNIPKRGYESGYYNNNGTGRGNYSQGGGYYRGHGPGGGSHHGSGAHYNEPGNGGGNRGGPPPYANSQGNFRGNRPPEPGYPPSQQSRGPPPHSRNNVGAGPR